MTDRHRPLRGLTLPELLAVGVLLAAAAAAVIAVPSVGRDHTLNLAAAATAETVIDATVTLYVRDGRLDDHDRFLDELNDTLGARYILRGAPTDPDDPIFRFADDQTIPNPALHLTPEQAGSHASVAWLPGTNAAVGVAVRAETGDCLLTRVDLGVGAAPQRFGQIPTDGTIPCQGDVALALTAVERDSRSGASWSSPLLLERN